GPSVRSDPSFSSSTALVRGPISHSSTQTVAKRRYPPYTNRRKLPLSYTIPAERSQSMPNTSTLGSPSHHLAPHPTERRIDELRLTSRLRSSVFLFVILAAQLMVVLDATIVTVALPHIETG